MQTAVAYPTLVDTLAEWNTCDEYFKADIGPLEADWFCVAELHKPYSQHLVDCLAHVSKRHEEIQTRTVASLFIDKYAWFVPGAAIGCYLRDQRVPDMSPENMALRLSHYTWHEDGESGTNDRFDVRFLSTRCAVLPNDPLADHPDTLVLANKAALRDWLRASIEAHVVPLIEHVSAMTNFRKRGQWNLIADGCAALFLHAGQLLGMEAYGRAEGLAFVGEPTSPLHNKHTGYTTIIYEDYSESFRARGGCCRRYTLPDNDKCATCVLRSPEDRDQILFDYVMSKCTHPD